MRGWTDAHIEKLSQRGMVAPLPAVPKLSKYGNRKTVLNDIIFDSKREADRYEVLKHWQEVGAISNLNLQVPFELNVGGTHSLIYKADFVYLDNIIKEEIVEDVKGFLTKEYRKKRRLMWKVYKIKIKET